MAQNRFGIFYVITRIALAVLILVQLVWLIINFVQQCKDCDTKTILWHVFTLLVLLVGLIGAWKEHFLSSIVFAITEIILVSLGFAMFAKTGGTSIAIAFTLVCSVIYTLMLYYSGKRDMNVPEVC